MTSHVLKHSVISWLGEKFDPQAIADFTQTSRETVERVYRKVNPGALRPLAESLSLGISGPKWPINKKAVNQ